MAAGYDPTQLADQWKRRTQREELCLILNSNPRPMSGMSDGIVEMDLTQLLGTGLDRADSRAESMRSVSGLDKASSVGGSRKSSNRSSNVAELKARIQAEQKKANGG